jgi:predicted DCC family thiol-disulfide oxidoreductase YuxK
VFDGDCGICRYWVVYWQGLTGKRVAYRPYQEAAADFPGIPPEAFRGAIQLIEKDGTVYAGAAATFRLLAGVPGRGLWWWLYAHLPLFAPLSERAYAYFAHHRGRLDRLTKLLWGPALEAERYDLVRSLFLRILGATYIAAFASLGVQIVGLAGHDGILPLAEFLDVARRAVGATVYAIVPTLFWLNASDTALIAGCVAGALLGACIVLGWQARLSLIGAYVLYLSYVYAGQDFMSFQWDSLLLEVGFLAIFLTGKSRIVVWLYRWLLFRYLLLAGAVKLLSGDATWRSLTALDYHFWSQPLPTPLAWPAAELPHWLLEGGTAATLIVELVIPFLLILPRRPRTLAALFVIAFQLLIILTGNYNFFNLLTIGLCIFLFDDAALRRFVPRRLAEATAKTRSDDGLLRPSRAATVTAMVLALFIVPLGVNRIWQAFMRTDLPVVGTLSRIVSPFLIVNPYGLFAVMTTTRHEIVIEGSSDGELWREYVFRYKPGPVDRPARWNIPHQPRLDWQMWFAALGTVRENPWFANLMLRLLEGSPDVVRLFAFNPFPEHPPRYVRALVYDYRFADPSLRATFAQWWTRRLQGLYFPTVGLSAEAGSTPPSEDSKREQ